MTMKELMERVGERRFNLVKALAKDAITEIEQITKENIDSIKTNLVKVGDIEEGVPLYEFNFRNVPIKGIDLNTTSRFRGVLAQDLLETDAADAVSINDTGFYEVDYNLLSINFAKLS